MRVKKVKYLHDYKLEILFSDEKTKIVDLSDLINEGGFYFDPLKDIEFFKQVSLDDEKYPLSICWPNDADICPDVLYEMGKDIQEQKKPVKAKPRIGIQRKKSGEKAEIKYQSTALAKRVSKKAKI